MTKHGGRMTKSLLSLLVGFAVLLSGCATSGARSPAAFIRTELYFGAVDPAEWSDFLATVVTPRFPDGFSVFDMQGQWRAPSGEVRKLPSRMLVIIHGPEPGPEASIEAVRTLFKERFKQVSVLRASHPVSASF